MVTIPRGESTDRGMTMIVAMILTITTIEWSGNTHAINMYQGKKITISGIIMIEMMRTMTIRRGRGINSRQESALLQQLSALAQLLRVQSTKKAMVKMTVMIISDGETVKSIGDEESIVMTRDLLI